MSEDLQGANATNSFFVLVGQPGVDALAGVGPFDTEDAARKYAEDYRQARKSPAVLDILINPNNLAANPEED